MRAYRFVRSSRRGQYSVHRGDEHLGYVTKVVIHHVDRGVARSFVIWTPSTPSLVDLATAPTRDAAAIALWNAHQGRR